MPYRYFWVLCDGQVEEITRDDFERMLRSNRLLVAVYEGRKVREITFYKKGPTISVPVDSLSKLLKMLER